jgi:hypothetical protein
VAAGALIGIKLKERFSARACPYLRLVVAAPGRQTASAAVFAVAFRFVVVVFRFIRAHKSKIAIYKGQLYCPFCKMTRSEELRKEGIVWKQNAQ